MFNFAYVMGTNPNRESVFRFKRFSVLNSNSAMKVGTDGVLLGAWCSVEGAGRVLDVGTGTGLIALMVAQRSSAVEIDAVDVVQDAVDEAVFNVNRSPWHDRITVSCVDFNRIEAGACGMRRPYGLVVSNPPFYKAQVKSPDYARSMARHGDGLDYRMLIRRCAEGLLAPSGRLSMILPAEFDSDVTFEAEMARMKVVRKISVFTKKASATPSRTLWELSADGTLPTEYGELRIGSDEYRRLTEPFYL